MTCIWIQPNPGVGCFYDVGGWLHARKTHRCLLDVNDYLLFKLPTLPDLSGLLLVAMGGFDRLPVLSSVHILFFLFPDHLHHEQEMSRLRRYTCLWGASEHKLIKCMQPKINWKNNTEALLMRKEIGCSVWEIPPPLYEMLHIVVLNYFSWLVLAPPIRCIPEKLIKSDANLTTKSKISFVSVPDTTFLV